jgi:hypothetical protein
MSSRALPMVNRAADVAPAAQACCGLCRTCTTTNLVGLAVAGFGAIMAAAAQLAKRFATAS